MLNKLIAWSLRHKVIVVAATVFLCLYGIFVALRLPVDVLPDLNRPTVTIFTESAGMAPEEVETLVSFPIETAMNGAPGVTRVRSASGVGLSLVYVEFDWSEDIYRARQIVSERLQVVKERMPDGINPTMGPISGIMGEVIQVGMFSKNRPSYEVRAVADWVVRPRLLSIPGVAQVSVIGGGAMQYQVLANPNKLRQFNVSVLELNKAVSEANVNSGGGYLMTPNQEVIIRNVGRVEGLEDIKASVIKVVDGTPITVREVAEVKFGRPVLRGDASVLGNPGVVLSVQKAPGVDTLKLTESVLEALNEVRPSLPTDIELNDNLFRATHFINTSLKTVESAMRDAFILVSIVLFAFLLNFRTTFISLAAIPVSMLVAAITFNLLGLGVNTMTLGGLAVAIGVLVDDAIIDVENVFRRLKENSHKVNPDPPLRVIYRASREVRGSILFATLIIALVFLPLFALTGLEGKIFTPLAITFIVSLFASLLVALTLTPVLCAYLLPTMKQMDHAEDPKFVRWLKRTNNPLVKWSIRNNGLVIGLGLSMLAVAVGVGSTIGSSFPPPFNEGSYNVKLILPPGTSLEETNRIGGIAEKILLGLPQTETISRRTGRAELDDHAEGVNTTEMELRPKPGTHRMGFEMEMREQLAKLPGVSASIGQPISHRIDHALSGVRAQIAIKVFGQDLDKLRRIASDVEGQMRAEPGIVDLSVEKQVEIPQIKITIDRSAAARYGLTVREVSETLETAFNGHPVSQVIEGQRTFDLVVWFDESSRNDLNAIRNTLVKTPVGAMIPLNQLASITESTGPNTIYRENVQRRITVSANVAGRDLGTVINAIQSKVSANVKMDEGYYVTYGGQFESQQAASRTITVLGIGVVAAIFLLLFVALKSWRMALQVMVNLPLAFVGGVVALKLTGLDLSIAATVGFITLFGIATRNGIMMLTHYVHLIKEEGERFGEDMILRGTQERLSPVLMTAISASLGMVPFALGGDTPGKEIMHPVAVVLLGGLVTSTLLNQVVTPALFWRFGRREWANFHTVPRSDEDHAFEDDC
ncbi:MAG TPA: efflux RND transporter permease subunit [Fimbriimonadaceae bacterium]|nr:efflux RND transporter permease subunit [Fimbriimonadaceae bacterium]